MAGRVENQEELDKCLEVIQNSLNALDKNDIIELKFWSCPPSIVVFTLHLVSLLLENKIQKKVLLSLYFNCLIKVSRMKNFYGKTRKC